MCGDCSVRGKVLGAVGFGAESVVPGQWFDIPPFFQKYSGFYILVGGEAGVKTKDNASIEPKNFDIELWDWKNGCLREHEAASGESLNPML